MNETFFSRMYWSLSLLARRGLQKLSMLMWKTSHFRGRTNTLEKVVYALFISGIFVQAHAFQGYNVVITTSSQVQDALLATATNQFLATEIGNPFVANTYTINLNSLNPNYVAPGQVVPSLPAQIDQDVASLVKASTWTYIYGWRDGASYLENSEIGIIASMSNLCANATNFNLIYGTTATWNGGTCRNTIVTIVNQLFSLNTGTPTVITGEP